jgi:hypothetical protein
MVQFRDRLDDVRLLLCASSDVVESLGCTHVTGVESVWRIGEKRVEQKRRSYIEGVGRVEAAKDRFTSAEYWGLRILKIPPSWRCHIVARTE